MKTLVGLFFDDASLALAVVILLIALAVLTRAGLLPGSPAITIVPLVGGTVLLLLENVIRAARNQRH